ncbi:methionyl-tRNA formyltransferase [Aerococcus urinaehominis]|uniref:Methionyl-tRNA formyltransferase n=1 Tax=Aerococcus urinaehominis TaxID=128944 RepID=A0A109RGT1_9LACT|nr:methionyl-tRNA formyltransferase [Aerococcus urinaehominis]AMB98976.1 methionyl-tRNA formyltransferase [Aerococcus urinaehominis]SDM37562.1 methionyl-tRNA formyltransferase [Aerococcus urinaehominis]
MKKIVFMGTPAFSVPILQALVASPDYQVVAVVTQPDRPVGRKRKLQASPVKEAALAHDIPLYQPEKIGQDQELAELLASDCDLIVTAAFGQFLPERLLKLPKYGAVNVHASLLPKYRGGAPVHYAIWQGETETGVTIMRMVKAMDAGAILSQAAIPIEDQDTVASMFDKLSIVGRDLLMTTLPDLFAGKIQEVPQDEALASYSPNISRDQERVDWQQSAQEIHNQIRAFNSWPVAHTMLAGERWKLWASQVTDQDSQAQPGTIVEINKKPARFYVATGDGSVLALTEIQPAGKKKMDIASFINGGAGQLQEGDRFDPID